MTLSKSQLLHFPVLNFSFVSNDLAGRISFFKPSNIHSPYNIQEMAGGNMNKRMPDSKSCTFKYSDLHESFPGFHRLHTTSDQIQQKVEFQPKKYCHWFTNISFTLRSLKAILSSYTASFKSQISRTENINLEVMSINSSKMLISDTFHLNRQIHTVTLN